MTNPKRLLVMALCLGIVLVVVAFDGLVARNALLAVQSQSWPTSSGIIEEATLVPGHRAYSAHVQYRYEVDGRERVGRRIAWNLPITAEQFVKEHPPGTHVTVYHDPGRPSRACLIPGNPMPADPIGRVVLVFLIVGANVMLLIAMCGLWKTMRQ